MNKIFVVGGHSGLESWFNKFGFKCVNNPFEADMFQFMGGEDVTPELYHQDNRSSYSSFNRDVQEAGYFAIAQRLNKPCVGICRGGQFLNVMCGGSMIQHVDGHTRDHKMIIVKTGKEIVATSTHHQMMMPNDDAVVLAYASIVKDIDPEVVWYKEQRCLCFQPHPEYQKYKLIEEYYFQLIHSLILEN